MPAADHSLALRGAVMARLKDPAAGVVAVVPADRQRVKQPSGDMDWPWIRWGAPINVPTEWSGLAGGETEITLHVFEEDSTQAHRIARLVQRALDEQRLVLDPEEGVDDPDHPPFVLSLLHTRTEVVADAGRPGAFHAIVRFTAETAEEI